MVTWFNARFPYAAPYNLACRVNSNHEPNHSLRQSNEAKFDHCFSVVGFCSCDTRNNTRFDTFTVFSPTRWVKSRWIHLRDRGALACRHLLSFGWDKIHISCGQTAFFFFYAIAWNSSGLNFKMGGRCVRALRRGPCQQTGEEKRLLWQFQVSWWILRKSESTWHS